MNPTYFAWLCLISVLFYAFSVDPNVEVYLKLWLTRLNQKSKIAMYKIAWNPKFPWARYRIQRIASRNAEENATRLRKELNMGDD